MKIVLRLGFYTFAILASVGVAALSDQYAAFGKGPARFVMTREELSTWKTVKDDAAAKAFVEQFWARRDPAFHDQFDQAVAFADEKFTLRKKRGSMTDMGRVLIIMGPPSAQREYKMTQRFYSPPTDDETDMRHMGTGDIRCWVYKAQQFRFPIEREAVEICFDDRYGRGDWLLLGSDWYGSLLENVNRSRLLPPVRPRPSPISVPNP